MPPVRLRCMSPIRWLAVTATAVYVPDLGVPVVIGSSADKLWGMRIVAISDIHLGRKSTKAREAEWLVPLFEGADLAVINGDGVDFGWMARDEAFELRDRLLAALKPVAGRVLWVRGNHDLPVEGPILHREEDVVFTHGHALFKVPKGMPTYQAAFDAVYDSHLKRHSTHRHGGPIANLAERLAMQVIPLPLASRLAIGDPRAVDLDLLLEAAGEEVRDVVIGHLHITGSFQRDGFILHVTGAWTGNAQPSAFVLDGEFRGLRAVHRGPRGFELG